VQKLSGDAAVALRQTTISMPADAREPQTNAQPVTLQFRKTGKPRFAKKTAMITARRKSTEWSALEKPVAPPTESAVRRKIRPAVVLWSWRRDSNPRPSDYKSDALPTELRQQI
jgi:hypothetical protein